MKTNLFTFILIASMVMCFSCENETTDNSLKANYSEGILVVNQGNMNHQNADISFISSDNKVYNNIYYSANNEGLGDVAQSATAYGNYYFVVVNNSNKVEIVNQSDFTRVHTISGLFQPRFITFAGGKGYLTQWGLVGMTGSVAIINLSSYSIEKTLTTGSGPEKMIAYNNMIYVSNSGGFGTDSTLTILNTTTGEIVKTLKVGYNPSSMVIDKNNRIWVLCSGKYRADYTLEQPGSLVCVNPETNTVESSYSFATISQPSSLCLNTQKDKLIYIFDNKVFEMTVTDQHLPAVPKINRGFYNVAVDSSTSVIYASDPKTYVSNGYVIRYKPDYSIIDSFKVGNIPGEIVFHK